MKTSEKVRIRIDEFEKGFVFTYDDFDIEMNESEALKKYLNRLVESNNIKRLSKGRFYKPKKGIINDLKPNEYEVVKDLLIDGNKTIGYITGYSIFNSLKLTTQVPDVIQIAVNFDKKAIKRGIYTVKFVRQWNKITQTNIPLLQLLDCIRFIKSIPDTTITNSINRITILLKELSESKKKQIVDLAINYPPSTRALLGAILEQSGYPDFAEKLLKTLKSTTCYSFNIPETLLPNKLKWKIK